MAKRPKVKKYLKKTSFYASDKRKKWIINILFILLVVVLVFVGVSSYPAIKKLVGGEMKPSPIPEITELPASITTPKADVLVQPEAEPAIGSVEKLKLRGVTIPYDIAVDKAKTEDFLSAVPSGITTVLFEIKDSLGRVMYLTENPDAEAWQSVVGSVSLGELRGAVTEKGLSFGVELSVFSDPIAAKGNLDENAIMHSSGVIWLDNSLANGGKSWVTPYSTVAREYNLALIKEAVDAGAEVVLLNHLNFPKDPTSSANVKAVEGVSRRDAINLFYSGLAGIVGEDVAIISTISYTDINGGNSGELYGGDPFDLEEKIWAVRLAPELEPMQIIARDGVRIIPIKDKLDDKYDEYIIK